MEDMNNNVFPYFDSAMEEDNQSDDNDDELLYFDETPTPDHQDLRFSQFLLARPVEIPQVNVDMIPEVQVNAFNNNMMPINYNHHQDMHSNPTMNTTTNSDHLIGDPMDSTSTGQPIDSANTGPDPMDSTNTARVPMDSTDVGGLFPPIPLSEWPIPPTPFSCSCCHVLRQIMHTLDDNNLTRLEVHGTLGMITHAILETRSIINGNRRNEFQMFDFCKKSIEIIRDWLIQYCEDRRKSGFKLIQDPLLLYYEALCVGLYGDDYLDMDDLFIPFVFDGGNNNNNGGSSSGDANNNNNNNGGSSSGPGDGAAAGGATNGGEGFQIFQGNQQQQPPPPPPQQLQQPPPPQQQLQLQQQQQPPQQQLQQQQPQPQQQQQQQQEQQQQPAQQQQQQAGAENNGGGRPPRTSLAAQRLRTGLLSLVDLREHFHFPMEEAARRMNICPTVMKKVCRREGLSRWPYRKIKSIQRKIIGKQATLNTKVGDDRRRIRVEIEVLQQQVSDLIEGILR